MEQEYDVRLGDKVYRGIRASSDEEAYVKVKQLWQEEHPGEEFSGEMTTDSVRG